ncbi:MAG: CBS domain-containing protein [Xanthobacteraceae bacterium]|nr:CBS domain-containing protein [Xanthobacteraceae bacterium]
MAGLGNATALAAVDAVVVDTETTGLDAAKAWIVEIAAMRIAGGRLDAPPLFRNLIDPGEPIPKAAVAVHGIDDAAVAGAPRFHAVASDIAAVLAAPVLIGHSLGFDLAVLKREFARANVVWQPPPTLDTRLLAEVAAPGLAGYSLESLSAWLGVPMAKRHSATGDAETTARIFLALVPKLRDIGIRTLAEAQRACRGRSATLETQHRAGWAEPVQHGGRASPVPRIDSYPYRHRIADVMSAPARFTPPDAPLAGVLQRMMDERVSSLFVHPDGSGRPVRADETGIVTERDVLRALAKAGAAALDQRSERHRQPSAGHGGRGFVLLSRRGTDEPARPAASWSDGYRGLRDRRGVGPRHAAAARRRRDRARRRDPGGRRRCRPCRRLVATAAHRRGAPRR